MSMRFGATPKTSAGPGVSRSFGVIVPSDMPNSARARQVLAAFSGVVSTQRSRFFVARSGT
jgi:hypothetical protein